MRHQKAADRTVTLKTTTTPGGSTATATIGAAKKKASKNSAILLEKRKPIAAFSILIRWMVNITLKFLIAW